MRNATQYREAGGNVIRHMHSTLRRSLLALAAIALVSCETAPPRQVDSAQAVGAAIGVQLKGIGPLGAMSTQTPQQAIFVKLEGDKPFSEELVRSNFGKDGRLYLLNASPGIYAVVAAAATQPSPLAYGSPVQEVTFFSRELVELTRVEVRAGEFAFAGKFEVTMSTAFEGGDDVQLHYRKLIMPAAPPGGFLKGIMQMLGGDKPVWGASRNIDKSAAARASFLQSAREDLAGRGWEGRLVDAP
jgi:hypothetical protein